MVRANASSIISDLGGGQHGHIGLVIPDAEYNRITGYIYNKPSHPGDLKFFTYNIFTNGKSCVQRPISTGNNSKNKLDQ